jgi:hypothetical protein
MEENPERAGAMEVLPSWKKHVGPQRSVNVTEGMAGKRRAIPLPYWHGRRESGRY